MEVKCEYCGGVYDSKKRESCPGCGARRTKILNPTEVKEFPVISGGTGGYYFSTGTVLGYPFTMNNWVSGSMGGSFIRYSFGESYNGRY